MPHPKPFIVPEMLLFLEYRAHMNVALEPTFTTSLRGMPAICRSVFDTESR